jgi:CubicO group peptidase (beta-lactamase class C family)
MDALSTVQRWPVDHAAVGVVDFPPQRVGPTPQGALPTDPYRGRPVTVGPSDRVFAWASVTKVATALAVLVALEEGTVDLDQPAGPRGSTVRHLLAHASGLGPEPGAPLAPPGAVRIYSNAGYTVLADVLAERSSIAFADYLRQAVLEPLGLDGTVLDDTGPSGAASGLSGPLSDLLALGIELARPTLVSETTVRVATTVHFPDLVGVLPGFGRFDPCPWGLGPEVRGAKSPHWTGATNSPATFGHFGQSGSFLWVDPDADVVCCGLADRRFGPWSQRAWPALADAVLAEVADRRFQAGPDG